MNQPQHWYKALAGRQEVGNYRNLRINDSGVDFLSNDYLGMTINKAFQQHLLELLNINPELLSGSTGSRLISGNSPICEEVEEFIAKRHRTESALLFPSDIRLISHYSHVLQAGIRLYWWTSLYTVLYMMAVLYLMLRKGNSGIMTLTI